MLANGDRTVVKFLWGHKSQSSWLSKNDNLATQRKALFETKIENLKASYNVDIATGTKYGSMTRYYIITNKNA